MKNLILIACLALGVSACTDNNSAKNFGGTQTINLEKDRKLINVTWKEPSSLWILTRERHEDEPVDSYTFKEKSSLGLVEGKVILNETK